MGRLFAIALNTFREAMRNKLLYTILLFACLIIVGAAAIGQFSLHEEVRVTRDLGLGGISLFGVILAVFAGVNLVYKEIERKTLYVFIPKPLHRWQFVVGKYLGLLLTLAIQVALMAVVLSAALLFEGSSPDGPLARAIVLLYMQVAVVTAIALLFSTFSTPFLSGLYTIGLFLIGRSTPELHALVGAKFKTDPLPKALLDRAIALLPDLHLFFVSGSEVSGKIVSVNRGDYVSWSYVASASGYGLLYAGCTLAIAMYVFSKRDFV